ncbi:tRNA glutamyl-Q(34) synthetase GluQRS [Tistrella mobilis]|uniref:tRNA glutamyl-Q(34) synthetase GluQRS n=1 Tax=Tistrella mobilis TaxID=171437 RepID=UPI0035576C6F
MSQTIDPAPPAVMPVTRFAPSPTGLLHLGHALSAILSHDYARAHGGRFILRIEDIDTNRCRPEFVDAIFRDLDWLGLSWDGEVRRQSEHFDAYRTVLDALMARDLVYPCFCTRSEIEAEIAASASAPHGPPPAGPDGPLYPGTCRRLTPAARATRLAAGHPHALRLDMAAALAALGPGAASLSRTDAAGLSWTDMDAGPVKATPAIHGDVVLARKDVPASYHLAVTHDDALQGITHIIRGRDLEAATHLHRLLQALMGWPVPVWRHHRLLTDDQGRRLAKRTPGVRLADLREAGVTPAGIRRRLGLADAD